MNSGKIDNILANVLESHSGFGPSMLLIALGIAWIFVFTELLPVTLINEKFAGFTITPATLLFFFVIANIYGIIVLINSRIFNRKLIQAAEIEGVSKTEIELFLSKQRARNAVLDGNLHGHSRKNINRLRKGT